MRSVTVSNLRVSNVPIIGNTTLSSCDKNGSVAGICILSIATCCWCFSFQCQDSTFAGPSSASNNSKMKFSLQLATAATLLASAHASNLTTEAVARPPPPPPPPPACRYLPSDPQWPNAAAWKSLNSSVGGRLIATVPIGTPCHDPKYNKAVCAQLQSNWELPQTQFVAPTLFAGACLT